MRWGEKSDVTGTWEWPRVSMILAGETSLAQKEAKRKLAALWRKS